MGFHYAHKVEASLGHFAVFSPAAQVNLKGLIEAERLPFLYKGGRRRNVDKTLLPCLSLRNNEGDDGNISDQNEGVFLPLKHLRGFIWTCRKL